MIFIWFTDDEMFIRSLEGMSQSQPHEPETQPFRKLCLLAHWLVATWKSYAILTRT